MRREYIDGGIYHITHRGNNKRIILSENRDYERLINIIAETKNKIPFKLYHYSLMPNHKHLNLEIRKADDLAIIMKSISHKYSLFHKRKYQRTGTLWEGPYDSKLLKTDEHLLMCGPYIELNPVRANLTLQPGDWHWSSYKENAGIIPRQLTDPNPLYFPGVNPEFETAQYIKTVAAWSKRKKIPNLV